MKFLVVFAALVSAAAAVYVAPVAQHAAFSPYAIAPSVYGAHHLYKRGIYAAPVAYTGYAHQGYAGYAHPLAAVHYRERRGIYTPSVYTPSAYSHADTPALYGAHHLYKRGIYAYPAVPVAHQAYSTPLAHYY